MEIFSFFKKERAEKESTAGSGGYAKIRVPKQSSLRFAKSIRRLGKAFRHAPLLARADKVRTIVKSRYTKGGLSAPRKISQRLDYIKDRKRDPEREPEQRKLYDDKGNDIELKQAVEDLVKHRGDKAAFHEVMLSPGDNSIDMVEYTRHVMKEFETRHGAELSYYFSVHKNTDHYHSHILIAGRPVDYLSHDHAIAFKGNKLDELYIDKTDLDFLRKVGDEYLYRDRDIDRAYDLAIEKEFGLGPTDRDLELLQKERDYNRQVDRDFRLSNTAQDRQALKELNLEPDAYQQIVDRSNDIIEELKSKLQQHKVTENIVKDQKDGETNPADQSSSEQNINSDITDPLKPDEGNASSDATLLGTGSGVPDELEQQQNIEAQEHIESVMELDTESGHDRDDEGISR